MLKFAIFSLILEVLGFVIKIVSLEIFGGLFMLVWL